MVTLGRKSRATMLQNLGKAVHSKTSLVSSRERLKGVFRD